MHTSRILTISIICFDDKSSTSSRLACVIVNLTIDLIHRNVSFLAQIIPFVYLMFFSFPFLVMPRHLYHVAKAIPFSNTVEREKWEAWKLETERKADGREEERKEWSFAAAKFQLGWWMRSGEEDIGGLCRYNSPLSHSSSVMRLLFSCWRSWMFNLKIFSDWQLFQNKILFTYLNVVKVVIKSDSNSMHIFFLVYWEGKICVEQQMLSWQLGHALTCSEGQNKDPSYSLLETWGILYYDKIKILWISLHKFLTVCEWINRHSMKTCPYKAWHCGLKRD